jgi:hypothetical protein
MVDAVRDRVEVAWHPGHDGEHDGTHPGEHAGTWLVTAGSFEAALDYARERFTDPVVLSRRDRNRWWPRVTIEVSEDPSDAASAPPLEQLAHPPEPAAEPAIEVDRVPDPEPAPPVREDSGMPAILEEMFARQDVPVATSHRVPRQRRGR